MRKGIIIECSLILLFLIIETDGRKTWDSKEVVIDRYKKNVHKGTDSANQRRYTEQNHAEFDVHHDGSEIRMEEFQETMATSGINHKHQTALAFPGKKGIGMTMRDPGNDGSWVENVPRVKYLNPSWYYAWNRKIPPEAYIEGVEFVPMIWTAWSCDALKQRIEEDILPDYIAGRTKRLLGFNEPDRTDQANMTVEKAVECWPYLEAPGMPLGGPVVADNAGLWMQEWIEQVTMKNLRVDYTTLHWFGWPKFKAFKKLMRKLYKLNGKAPLLITELAPADWKATKPEEISFTKQKVLSFMKKAIPWMESRRWIAGYAWFPFNTTSTAGANSALFELDGIPTTLARFYASVTPNNPSGDQSISFF